MKCGSNVLLVHGHLSIVRAKIDNQNEHRWLTLTQADAAVLQKVAEMVKHRALVLSADATEVTQETAAVGHHLRESNLLERQSKKDTSWPTVVLYCNQW